MDLLDSTQEARVIEKIKDIIVLYGDVKNETLGKGIHRWILSYDEKSLNIKIEINKRIRTHNTYELKNID